MHYYFLTGNKLISVNLKPILLTIVLQSIRELAINVLFLLICRYFTQFFKDKIVIFKISAFVYSIKISRGKKSAFLKRYNRKTFERHNMNPMCSGKVMYTVQMD